jgi:hypothetical protein
MKGWKKGAWFHIERAFGDLIDAGGNAKPMKRLGGKRLQHQQVESSLEKVSRKFVVAVAHIDNL